MTDSHLEAILGISASKGGCWEWIAAVYGESRETMTRSFPSEDILAFLNAFVSFDLAVKDRTIYPLLPIDPLAIHLPSFTPPFPAGITNTSE